MLLGSVLESHFAEQSLRLWSADSAGHFVLVVNSFAGLASGCRILGGLGDAVSVAWEMTSSTRSCPTGLRKGSASGSC